MDIPDPMGRKLQGARDDSRQELGEVSVPGGLVLCRFGGGFKTERGDRFDDNMRRCCKLDQMRKKIVGWQTKSGQR